MRQGGEFGAAASRDRDSGWVLPIAASLSPSQCLGVDAKVVSCVYQRTREVPYHLAELESGRLKGEIELDETYFGGWRKGIWGQGARGKSIVFGLLERDGRGYTKVVESVTIEIELFPVYWTRL